MSDRHWHLVAYDVRDPIRLRRVARHLLGYGERVQYSVFRCRLDKRTQARLLWELARIMTTDDDLLIVPICTQCSAAMVLRGSTREWPDESPSFRVL
jgi:CRISPR-associated protein Cas2